MPRDEARSFKVGDRVREDRHGTGIVHALRLGGKKVVVRFEDLPHLPVVLDAERLTPIFAEHDARTIESRSEALAIVESLKLGVVSGMAMDRLTVGNKGHLDGIGQDLDRAGASDPGGAFRLLVGTYGVGKTHTLDLTENIALKRRFLVARAVFDLQDVTPYKPINLYAALASSIRYPRGLNSGKLGLGPLLEEAASDPAVFRSWTGRDRLNDKRPLAPVRNRYFSTALFGLRMAREAGDDEVADNILSWIEGRPQNMALLRWRLRDLAQRLKLPFAILGKFGYNPMSLPHWQSVTQLVSYLLGSIGVLAWDLGYAGLASLLDEAEFFDVVHDRLKIHATRLVRALLTASLPGARCDDLKRGGSHRLSLLPYRFEKVQHVAAFMTMTPKEGGVEAGNGDAPHLTHIVESNGGKVSEIKALSKTELCELTGRVLGLAKQAGLPGATTAGLGPALCEYLNSMSGRPPSPRQTVRIAAQLPDIVRDGEPPTARQIRSWVDPDGETDTPGIPMRS